MQPIYGGQQEGNADFFDQVTGVGRWTGSVRMEERPNVEPYLYTIGKTGGAENNLVCSSYVYRSGKLFNNDKATIPCEWQQERKR